MTPPFWILLTVLMFWISSAVEVSTCPPVANGEIGTCPLNCANPGTGCCYECHTTGHCGCCNGEYVYSTCSDTPTGEPSSIPSCAPSGEPSSKPSSAPSGEPTIPKTSAMSWEGGTNSPESGVAVTFTELNTSLYTYYLTVDVYATDFAWVGEFVDGIYAGTTIMSSFCNPGVDNGYFFYNCLTHYGVTGDVMLGSLTVHTTATSEVNCCPIFDYYDLTQVKETRAYEK